MEGSKMSMKCCPALVKSSTRESRQSCPALHRLITAATPTSDFGCSTFKLATSSSVASSTMRTAQPAASLSLQPRPAATTTTSVATCSGALARFSQTMPPQQSPESPKSIGLSPSAWTKACMATRLCSWMAPTSRPRPSNIKSCKSTETSVPAWPQDTQAPYRGFGSALPLQAASATPKEALPIVFAEKLLRTPSVPRRPKAVARLSSGASERRGHALGLPMVVDGLLACAPPAATLRL
mmetsp:Transcript_75557/g.219468  ORF Transcript_75557/g.219468 Transcript_75557/m.219468 type:complete len:239 (-) Transcript_75557:542-1258(-)